VRTTDPPAPDLEVRLAALEGRVRDVERDLARGGATATVPRAALDPRRQTPPHPPAPVNVV
jgi:hypothetical protein